MARRDLAWPWLVQRELERQTGGPVELDHRVIFPVGPRAVPLALAAVDQFEPDVAVYSFGAFPGIVGTVGTRVRRRFGERTYRAFRRLELAFEGRTGSEREAAARINHAGRWLARRVIGTETITTFDEILSLQAEIMRGLARHEGLPVVAACEPNPSRRVGRENPQCYPLLNRFRVEMEALARSYRFLVSDCATLFDAAPDRDALFVSDGLHKSPAGHALQARAVLAALAPVVAGLAPALA